jgi:4-amino-4-deoxy-L-arabinose transferase-like glycosyltransferase
LQKPPNTEVFINACLVWALALLVGMRASGGDRARVIAVGALLALGTLYKPVVAVCAAFLVGAHVAAPPGGAPGRRRALADGALIVAIGAVAWVVVVGYFALTRRLADFAGAVFTYNGFYTDTLVWNLLQGLAPRNLLPGAMVSLLPLVTVSLLGLTLVRWRMSRGKRCCSSPWPPRSSSRSPLRASSTRTTTNCGCRLWRWAPPGPSRLSTGSRGRARGSCTREARCSWASW